MGNKKENQLVPYDMISPGWEAEYTGESDISLVESNPYYTYSADTEGNVMVRYSQWGFEHLNEESWNDEIRYINLMQSKLGFLDENIRRIRHHIGGLVCCDSGVPVTVDEILNIIGTGHLPEPSFHRGCFGGNGTRITQPNHVESMKVIEDVLKGFLNGKLKEEFITKYPLVKGFINRTYVWLESSEEFSELQRLLMRRMLLPFEYFTKSNDDVYAISNNCFEEGGEGFKLDEQISELAGLPKIFSHHKKEHQANLDTISELDKRELYKICGNIASGGYEMSDCHHNIFRVIENWIYAIGTLRSIVPTRVQAAEGKRVGQILFGYALGIDKWLQGIPHQFLLLDLGHIDLRFNPKNEILRVYAYLGEKRTPINKWLAACLWYMLTHGHAGLYNFTCRHKELIENAKENGISFEEWIDSSLEDKSNE
jgi:hypothetical protein